MKKQQSNNNTEKRKSEIMLENDRDDAAKKLKVGKVDYTVEGDRLESAESETNQELMLRERWKRNKANQRNTARDKDEADLRKTWSAEKAKQRNKARKEDEEIFRSTRSKEKAKERKKARDKDEDQFRAKRSLEKLKERVYKKSTMEERSKLFKNAIKDGRRFECISCDRLCFKNGVYQITKEFLEHISPEVLKRSTGSNISQQTIENQDYLCFTCKNYIIKKKLPPMSTQNNLKLIDLSRYEE